MANNVIQLASGRQFKNMRELQEYADAQYLILESMQLKMEAQGAKIAHLEELLDGSLKVESIIKTPEQGLIENQLNRLVSTGLARELSSEEIKNLDVLLKNKALLNGQATAINGETKKKKELSPAELTIIAKREK